MSNWSDIIAAHTTGTLSYTFTPSINATIKCYARLLSDDYTGQAIYRLSDEAGTHYVQLEGQTSDTLKLVEYPGASVLITDIPVLHNTWQLLVLVVTLTQVHIYQNGVLINSGFLANPLQVASMLFYNTVSQLYDELVHIPSVVSTEQIERWQEQEWPVVTADPGGSYEEQYALGTLAEPTGTWSSSPPVVDNGEYLWMRKRWVEGDGTPGDWSTPVRIKGDMGDQGPPGEVGRLGLYADGTTLHLKAYSTNGELTAEYGYLYVGPERITVPTYSQALTETGLGYVVMVGSNVAYAKMTPNDDHVVWAPYEGGAALNVSYVIGRFKKTGLTISDMELFAPVRPETFINERFMELLAERDESSIEEWALALGVEKVFKKIAILEAFVDQLKVNYAESGTYTEDAYGNPIVGFVLDGYSNLVKIAEALITRATIQDTIIRGKITINANDSADPTDLDDENAVLKTSFGATGVNLGTVTPSRWRGADACAAVSLGAEGSVVYDSVSYDYFRCSSTTQLELITIGTAGGGGGATTGDVTYTVQHPGTYRVWLNFEGPAFINISSEVTVYKNGVVLLHTETGHVSSYYYEFNTGDVIRIVTATHNAYLYMDEDGLVLTNNDYVSVFFIPNDNTAFSKRLIIDTSVWDSNNAIVMGTVTTWAGNITVTDEYLPCDIANSEFTYNGSTYAAAYILKTTNLIQIITASGPLFTFSTVVDSADVATSGWYRLAGSIVTVSEQRGLITDHLYPNQASSKNIGAANNKYASIFGDTGNFGTMNSTIIVNEENANNEVWGAVFN